MYLLRCLSLGHMARPGVKGLTMCLVSKTSQFDSPAIGNIVATHAQPASASKPAPTSIF